MRLWEKAKTQGVWNPADVDYAHDRQDWLQLPRDTRARLGHVCRAFQAGEEAVVANLLPLMQVIAREGRREEEIFLTSFLWDEARHVDLFQRFAREICGADADDAQPDVYGRMLDEELGRALDRLRVDASPIAQVRASVTYHLVVEGVMAETGYLVFRRMLDRLDRLKGMREAVTLLQRDESRHIAYGVYLLGRLIAEHGDVAYRAFLERIAELRPIVAEATRRLIATLDGEASITHSDVIRLSQHSFAQRVQRIARARTAGVAQLEVDE
jgi:ribonucleoside-diphosphate reductase beta chain